MSRTPIYTLFPYTTLFRSEVDDAAEVVLGDGLGAGAHVGAEHRLVGRGVGGAGRGGAVAVDVRDEHLPDLLGQGEVVRDRKSTRLNSSHMSISYAVFCLKK